MLPCQPSDEIKTVLLLFPIPPPAARANTQSGTDRLTNKVNKYFPLLLKANQILILAVWSAEK